MRKIILYIATSLDGFIARENGEVDWLDPFSTKELTEAYNAFYDSIDVTLMGNNTYKQILTFGEFPYKGKKNYVFTRQKNPPPNTEHVEFVNQETKSFMNELKEKKGKNIWLIGGSKLIESIWSHNIIDELILSLIPVTLGKGIPLFTPKIKPTKFKIQETKSYTNGIVELRYSINK